MAIRGGEIVRIVGARRVLLAGAAISLLGPVACASNQEQEKAKAQADPAAVAEIERKPWDAEKMTTLTAELARAVRDVRRAWRSEPAFRDSNNPNRRAAAALDENLRDLDQRTSQLATRVAGGAGFDETLNIARNIRVLLNDVDVNGRGIMTSQWMDERVRPAVVLINEIAAYYGSEAPFAPETLNRTDRPPQRR